MIKLKDMIIALIVVFLACFCFESLIKTIQYWEELSFEQEVKNNESYRKIKKMIDFSENEKIELIVIDAIYKIPENHIDLLIKNEWKIVISKEKLNEIRDQYLNKYVDYSGVTMNNIIYLNSEHENIKRTTLHEIGHAIDKELENISKKDDFIIIFEKEKEMIRYYAQTDSQEFWADLYCLYYGGENKEDKIEEFPLAKKYLKENLNF